MYQNKQAVIFRYIVAVIFRYIVAVLFSYVAAVIFSYVVAVVNKKNDREKERERKKHPK